VLEAVAQLREPGTIRARCTRIAEAVMNGQSAWFLVDLDQLDGAAALVERLTRQRYPDLNIPYHSRWRHFETGGIDRLAVLEAALAELDTATKARARIDLAMISVLLDAGAGTDWHYFEATADAGTERRYSRSEGLAVASFRAFMAGAFSSDPDDPWRVDGRALAGIESTRLAELLQVSDRNPLVGLEGRAALLRRLGGALLDAPALFGADARPGGLYDHLTTNARASGVIEAADILRTLLDSTSRIWPSNNQLQGQPQGDVWRHPQAGGGGLSAGWVPFHKLSQWLTYSLLEPFEWAGIDVTGRDALTALPEYRNGGLLLDSAVLVLRDADMAQCRWRPGDEMIVEWRALTIHLIDLLAERLRARLGCDQRSLPLACVLEGGTWAAGRHLANERRGGRPPLQIDSDGTVF
jgi:hypothetical protein